MSDMMLQLVNASDADVWVARSAMALKHEALVASRAVLSIASADEQAAAVPVMQNLKHMLNQVESSRKQVKEPVIDLGRKIDSVAKTFTADIELEMIRLGRLLSGYLTAERKKAEAAERARLAELARLAEEQRKAEQAEQAELDRINAEQRKAAMAQTELAIPTPAPKPDTAALEEAALLAACAEQKRARMEAAGPVVAPKAAGMVVRDLWRFEVTNDVEFARWAIESGRTTLIRITPSVRELLAAITNEKLRTVPGLRIWMETVADVRGGTR